MLDRYLADREMLRLDRTERVLCRRVGEAVVKMEILT